jgi:hypothetical protein
MIDYFALSLAVGCLFAVHGFVVRMLRANKLPAPTRGDGALFLFPFLWVALFYFLIAFDIGTMSLHVSMSRAGYILFILAAIWLNRETYQYSYNKVLSWIHRI